MYLVTLVLFQSAIIIFIIALLYFVGVFFIITMYPGIQFRLACTPRTIFHGCQIVQWDPLNAKLSCPKKDVGMAM